jgi:hypothetical protein
MWKQQVGSVFNAFFENVLAKLTVLARTDGAWCIASRRYLLWVPWVESLENPSWDTSDSRGEVSGLLILSTSRLAIAVSWSLVEREKFDPEWRSLCRT